MVESTDRIGSKKSNLPNSILSVLMGFSIGKTSGGSGTYNRIESFFLSSEQEVEKQSKKREKKYSIDLNASLLQTHRRGEVFDKSLA